MKRVLLVALAAFLLLAPSADAGGPKMLIGVADDFVKQPDPALAKMNMDLAALAGFDSLRVTAAWSPGQTSPSPTELELLRNAAIAAQLGGMQLFLAVYPRGSSVTPLTDAARGEFASFAASIARSIPLVTHFIVGNEPNLNRFWMPQFNLDGTDAAAPAYAALLARTYDALKAVSPRVTVIGGALAARGEDNPSSTRHTQSPGRFISDLGDAYRASGRKRPLMDVFAFHPYPPGAGAPPTVPHPNSRAIGLADYGRLVALLGRAFDGTAQRGSTLPILYAEFGVESQIPLERAPFYTGKEPASTRPVDEATQATYYRQAIELAHCQPTVRGIFYFLVVDEQPLERWQSGAYYTDYAPEGNLETRRLVSDASRRGRLTRCSRPLGVPLKPLVRFPAPAAITAGRTAIRLTCDLNCSYVARLERMPARSAVVTVRGRAVADRVRNISFARRTLSPGLYRFRVQVAAMLPGAAPVARSSRSFRAGNPRVRPNRGTRPSVRSPR